MMAFNRDKIANSNNIHRIMNDIVQSGHIWLLLSLNFLLYYYASSRIMPPTRLSKVNQLTFHFSYQKSIVNY